MAENTDWFEGQTIEENGGRYGAHSGRFVPGGSIIRAMSVLVVLALLGAGVMTLW